MKKKKAGSLGVFTDLFFYISLMAHLFHATLIYPVAALTGVFFQEVLCTTPPPPHFRVLPCVENMMKFSSATNMGVWVSQVTWTQCQCLSIVSEVQRRKGDSEQVENRFLGSSVTAPGLLSLFSNQWNKGHGFTKFGKGRSPGGIGVKLGDKNRISPVPKWQVKIKYDLVEKQQEGQPNGRVVQSGANHSSVFAPLVS